MKDTKGCDSLPFMQDLEERDRAIAAVVERLVGPGPAPVGMFGPVSRKLDVSRPNIHDSKAEFRAELDAVESAIRDLRKTLFVLLPPTDKSNHQEVARNARLRTAINAEGRRELPVTQPKSALDLVLRNAVEQGLYPSAMSLMLSLYNALEKRRAELLAQEATYWNAPNRPANPYARTIALRLAQLYAQNTGRRPTFGVARDGGHPSTAYGRALEEIYELLEIKANVRSPAKWAIAQITDEDLKPPPTPLFGMALGALRDGEGPPPPTSSIDKIVEAFLKGPSG